MISNMTILENVLTKIITKYTSESKLGLMYSGGLDSSIIAKILLKLIPLDSINFITVGELTSYDINNARKGAEILGFDLNLCILTLDKVRNGINDLKNLKFIRSPKDLSIAIPLYLGMKQLANEKTVVKIFLGQGADELFGGYNRYELMFEKGIIEKIKQQMKTDLDFLRLNQVKMEKELADKVGVELIYPYLDEELIEFAQNLPYNKLLCKNEHDKIIRKVYLREVANSLGLKYNMVEQDKKAIQYGSNTIKLIRAIVKADGYKDIRKWFDEEYLDL